MTKLKWLVPVVLLSIALTGCKQDNKGTTSSSSSAKPAIVSKQYTTAQLEKRYVKIADAVMKPLEQASYQESTATIKKTVTASQATIEQVRLELVDNNSEEALTKALIKYEGVAKTMLTTMIGTSQTAYTTASKNFSTQSSTIAKTYFNGQLPQSMINYSKRMQSKTSTSSSSSSAASSSSK